MVNGEDDVEIMNGQNPLLLVFQPLRFLERATFWAVTILTRLVTEFPLPALLIVAPLHDPAHGGCAAIQNGANDFRLRIRKPMQLFICADMLAEDLRHIERWGPSGRVRARHPSDFTT